MESSEQSVKFLIEAIKLMSNGSSKLVCHYLSRCRTYKNKRQMLPRNLINKSSICKSCGSNWSRGEFRAALLPRRRPGKRLRKLMRKADEHPYLLQKCEKRMLLMVDKIKKNKLVFVCKQCRKKTKIPMDVPEFVCDPETLPDKAEDVVASKKNQKRKKKVKDKFCGLNPSVFAPVKRLKVANSLPKSSDAAEKLAKTKFNASLNKSAVGNKKQSKKNQALLPAKVMRALQNEAQRRTLPSNSFINFLKPVT